MKRNSPKKINNNRFTHSYPQIVDNLWITMLIGVNILFNCKFNSREIWNFLMFIVFIIYSHNCCYAYFAWGYPLYKEINLHIIIEISTTLLYHIS